jgi:hypothetical protein
MVRFLSTTGGMPLGVLRDGPEVFGRVPIMRCVLRRGGGLVDAPGRGLVGAKGEYPF